MDKVFSTKIDEAVAFEIEKLAKMLKIPKKKVIENAVRVYAREAGEASSEEVIDRSWGAWRREESPDQTAQRARAAFEISMKRLHG